MFIPDFFLGWAMFFSPFVLVGWYIFRKRKSVSADFDGTGFPTVVNLDPFGSTEEHSTNINGLLMVGEVDVLGNPFGESGHTH